MNKPLPKKLSPGPVTCKWINVCSECHKRFVPPWHPWNGRYPPLVCPRCPAAEPSIFCSLRCIEAHQAGEYCYFVRRQLDLVADGMDTSSEEDDNTFTSARPPLPPPMLSQPEQAPVPDNIRDGVASRSRSRSRQRAPRASARITTRAVVALSALSATPTVAASATNAVLAFASNPLTLSDTLWHGLDFRNLKLSRCGGQVDASSADVLEVWLETEYARTLWPCMHPVLNESVRSLVRSLGFRLPAVESAWEELYNLSHYGSLQLQGSVLFTGQLHIVFEAINVTFEVLWSNPLWESLGFSPEAERGQILTVLRDTVAALPPSDVRWDAGVSAEVPAWLHAKALLSRTTRVAGTNFQVLWSLLCSRFLWGSGILVSGLPSLFRHRHFVGQWCTAKWQMVKRLVSKRLLAGAAALHRWFIKLQTGFEMVSEE